jgi:hypothetical protein
VAELRSASYQRNRFALGEPSLGAVVMSLFPISVSDLNRDDLAFLDTDFTEHEDAFAVNLLDSGVLPTLQNIGTLWQNDEPIIKAELSFMKDNKDLFTSAAEELGAEPIMRDYAVQATLAGQKPVAFVANGFVGLAESEGPAFDTIYFEDTKMRYSFPEFRLNGGHNFVAELMVLGGIASAYDSMNGTHTLTHIENSLTARGLFGIDLANQIFLG